MGLHSTYNGAIALWPCRLIRTHREDLHHTAAPRDGDPLK
jgi:hypothetical protein